MGKSCSHLSPLPNSMALEPIALSTAMVLISSCLPFVSPSNFCYPAIFNFGDSNSDTGGLVAGIAFPVGPPNGQTYFLKPSGRLCDGRLTIDFLNKELQNFLPLEEYFRLGLYMFDIGQNDLDCAFYLNSEDQVLFQIPTIMEEFETGIKDPSDLDEVGCVSSHNNAAKLFNKLLHAVCANFHGQFPEASLTFADIFSIKSNLISNYSQLGFKQSLAACCGYGGLPLNFDNRIACGETKNLNGSFVTANPCNNTAEYVNWDGNHYTEAANLYVSSQILTGKYSQIPNHLSRQTHTFLPDPSTDCSREKDALKPLDCEFSIDNE
ncbi:hypothetical protein RHMOL_Rhmol13G0027400 [Rhododendron molle]|uniref:Uncharacterized protein n=1 Tax=Rhododendron molle TaxID=49168 RepID=A0ACC0L3T9_RHOML|nr:hypothetical protein RHMOL_Rhmol13G0027400 [Rhododendron molle]